MRVQNQSALDSGAKGFRSQQHSSRKSLRSNVKTDNGNKAANITHATKHHQKSPVIDRQSPVEKEDDDFMPTYPLMEEVRS